MNNQFKRVAIEAAIKSGSFIKRSVGKITNISYKGRDNIVTNVDKSSERMIVKLIRSHFPKHSILSEEMGVLERDSEYRWIIDPLDGTTNFAHAFPFFCVSIALARSDDIILGVVYDPMRNELFSAQRGRGAFLNNAKITVSGVRKLSDGFVATGFSYGIKRKDKNISNFARLITRTMAIRRAGSAALDLSYVACGRFDAFWEMDLKPWDSAAGYLIVKEAKGKITKFDGSGYSPNDKTILASNGRIHSQITAMLKA